MSEVQTAAATENFWAGLGVSVESQMGIGGVNVMMANMVSFPDMTSSCWIRVPGTQFGPGLGGGGDLVLVIATSRLRGA
jgi:hypothetical protein